MGKSKPSIRSAHKTTDRTATDGTGSVRIRYRNIAISMSDKPSRLCATGYISRGIRIINCSFALTYEASHQVRPGHIARRIRVCNHTGGSIGVGKTARHSHSAYSPNGIRI